MLGELGVLLVALQLGQASDKLYDPPRVDSSPSAYACTAETLVSGERCVFEADSSGEGAPQNGARVEAMASQVCDAATRRGPASIRGELVKACLRSFTQAARTCATESVVVDAQGRFAEAGQACYRALSGVAQASQTLAAAAPGCCACLAEARCTPSADACLAKLASISVACGGERCEAACAEMKTLQPASTASTAKAKRKGNP